jgi:hypothetical protein
MNYYESELEGLESSIEGAEEEMDRYYGIMRDNWDDQSGSAYTTAYSEYEVYENEL